MSWTGPIIAGVACCAMMYLLERFTTWAVGPEPKRELGVEDDE